MFLTKIFQSAMINLSIGDIKSSVAFLFIMAFFENSFE